MKNLLSLALLCLFCVTAHAQMFYAVWNPSTLRYEFVTNAPGTIYIPGPGTVTIYSQLPLAVPDFAATTVNKQIVIPVMQNDINMSGNQNQLYQVFATNAIAYAFGTNVIYTPPLNFLGTNVFGYTITDGIGNFSTALVTVVITNSSGGTGAPTNSDGTITITYPGGTRVANDLNLSTGKNHAKTVVILTNTVSSQGNPLVLYSGVGTNMTESLASSTSLLLVPNTNAVLVAQGYYRVSDTYTLTNRAEISLNITNIDPVAVADAYTMTTNSTLTIFPMTNDIIDIYDVLNTSIIAISTVMNGTATLHLTNSSITVTSATNFPITFTYFLSDGFRQSSALVTITGTNGGTMSTNTSALIPNMTGDTAPRGIASASDETIAAYFAFQTNNVNGKWLGSSINYPPLWLAYTFTNAVTVSSFSGMFSSSASATIPYTNILQYSLDGSTWLGVVTNIVVTGASGSGGTAAIVTTNQFPAASARYWRWWYLIPPFLNQGYSGQYFQLYGY